MKLTKGEILSLAYDWARERHERLIRKTGKRFSYVTNYEKIGRLFEKEITKIAGQEASWSKLPKTLKRRVARKFLRKVISLWLDTETWKDKSFTSTRKKSTKPAKVFKGCVLLVEELEGVIDKYPRPEDFAPKLNRIGFDKKLGKPVVSLKRVKYDTYDGKFFNKAELLIEDVRETDAGFIAYLRFGLCREGLDFGRWREFAYLVEFANGLCFVDRVGYRPKNFEEALEWTKPAEVKKAVEEGRLVFKHGNLFFVELKGRNKKITDYDLWNGRKAVVKGNRAIIKHKKRKLLELPHPYFKAVPRKVV